MLRYCYYIAADTTIDCNTRYYVVSVPSALQGRRDASYLRQYAADHGHLFVLRSCEWSDFLDRVATSQGLSMQSDLGFLHITARQLVRHFKNGDLLPSSSANPHTSHHQRWHLDVNYRIAVNLHRK